MESEWNGLYLYMMTWWLGQAHRNSWYMVWDLMEGGGAVTIQTTAFDPDSGNNKWKVPGTYLSFLRESRGQHGQWRHYIPNSRWGDESRWLGVDQRCMLSHTQVIVTPQTVAHEAPLSVDFPGKNTGLGCHFLTQGIFLIQGLNPLLHGQVGCFSTEALGKPGSGSCCSSYSQKGLAVHFGLDHWALYALEKRSGMIWLCVFRRWL